MASKNGSNMQSRIAKGEIIDDCLDFLETISATLAARIAFPLVNANIGHIGNRVFHERLLIGNNPSAFDQIVAISSSLTFSSE